VLNSPITWDFEEENLTSIEKKGRRKIKREERDVGANKASIREEGGSQSKLKTGKTYPREQGHAC